LEKIIVDVYAGHGLVLVLVVVLDLDAENLALEQKVHYWLSISQRLSSGLYNTSEYEDD
jgi:hypothetical protein